VRAVISSGDIETPGAQAGAWCSLRFTLSTTAMIRGVAVLPITPEIISLSTVANLIGRELTFRAPVVNGASIHSSSDGKTVLWRLPLLKNRGRNTTAPV